MNKQQEQIFNSIDTLKGLLARTDKPATQQRIQQEILALKAKMAKLADAA